MTTEERTLEYTSDPDNVTMDLAVYGTNYVVVMNAFYQIDAMIDIMETENAMSLQTIDTVFFKNFMEKTSDLLSLPDHKVPEAYLDAVKMIRTYVENLGGIAELKIWRVDVDLWGRMHGAAQYGERMHIKGIPPWIWESASNQLNKKPIAYETVKEANR